MEEREAGKQIQSLLFSYILNAGNLEGFNHWYCKLVKRSWQILGISRWNNILSVLKVLSVYRGGQTNKEIKTLNCCIEVDCHLLGAWFKESQSRKTHSFGTREVRRDSAEKVMLSRVWKDESMFVWGTRWGELFKDTKVEPQQRQKDLETTWCVQRWARRMGGKWQEKRLEEAGRGQLWEP